jgi:hypothetical protein
VNTRSLISLRLGVRRNFCLYLHPNLVSSPIKGILEIQNLEISICLQIWTGKYVYLWNLPALDLTQSVYAKISIGMHRGVSFYQTFILYMNFYKSLIIFFQVIKFYQTYSYIFRLFFVLLCFFLNNRFLFWDLQWHKNL